MARQHLSHLAQESNCTSLCEVNNAKRPPRQRRPFQSKNPIVKIKECTYEHFTN